MSVIQIRTPNQGIVKVRIAGDTPTEEESNAIKAQFFSQEAEPKRNKTFADLLESTKKEDSNFDYTTGAGGKLRALISFGETQEEKEGILERLVGKDGYTKDESGRLALTEKGQIASGLEPVGKNLVIEEKGFTLRDISDFAGIAPEAILGTVGGVLGGTAGSIVPYAGTAYGSAIGGGAGAAAGQAIEEGIESLLGLQKQTIGEVAKDVAIEGAIGAGASLIGDFIIDVGKKAVGAASGRGAKLQAIDAEKLTQAERLVRADALPSFEAIGASKPLSYAQKLAEGATRMEKRVNANTEYALKQKDELLNLYGGGEGTTNILEEAGESVFNVGMKKIDDVLKAQKEAQNATFKAIDDSLDLLENSVAKDFDINDATLSKITGAFQGFSDISSVEFKNIDNILNTLKIPVTVGGKQVTKTGQTLKVFKTDQLNTLIDDVTNVEMGGTALQSLKQETKDIIKGIQSFGERASFAQVSRMRKKINDYLFDPAITPTSRNEFLAFRDALDDMLANSKIDIPEGVTLTSKQKEVLKKAATQRKTAMDNYREGLKRFEALEKHGLVRNVRAATKEPEFELDKFYSRIVEKNSPERLKAVLNAVDEPELVRSRLARTFLDDALFSTKSDLSDIKRFNGTNFYNAVENIDRLKSSTAKVLFGNKYGEVKALAKSLAYSGVKNLDDDAIKQIMAANPSGDVVSTLKALNKANIEADALLKSNILNNLQNGKLTPDDAVLAMSKPSITNSEIKKIKQFFGEGSETFEKIKQNTMREIVSTIDDTVFEAVGTAKALQNNLKKYKNGVLKELLGEDGEAALKQLADDLVVLGDVTKEGAIAAASLSASPIKNFPKLVRMRLTANMLADKDNLLRYIEIQKKLKASGAESTEIAYRQLFNEIAGADASEQASKKLSKAGNVFEKVRTASRVKDQALPRMFLEQINQTDVRNNQPIESSSLSNIDVFDTPIRNIQAPAQKTAPIQTQPLNLIDRVRQSAIRKRAAQNPAVASSLLGGLGSASLLNR